MLFRSASIVNKTFTNSSVKAVYDKNLPLDLKIHHCWGSAFKSYFDNISFKATAPIENTVNSEWKNSSFEMTTSPDVGDMANDDWEIATDPKLVAPSAFWDFETGSDLVAQNGIATSNKSNMILGKLEGDTVNKTNVFSTTEGKTSCGFGLLTFPGTIMITSV